MDNNQEIPEIPENRGEQNLNYLCKGEENYPKHPESRVEEYLDFIVKHGIGDDTGFNLIPECRLELYLDHIIKNGIPGGGGGGTGGSLSLRRLDSYLYEITFDSLPEYVESNDFANFGCTSFIKDGKLYRNLDWYYGNTAEFIVKYKDIVGMSFINGLNDGEVDSKVSQLPYKISDGNNKHLMVSTHVLYNDFNYEGSGSKTENITKLPFLILSTMTDVDTLSTEVSNLISNIKIPVAMQEQGYLIQVLVSDGITTKLFTPTSDGYEYVDVSVNPKLTNFKWLNKATLERNDSDLQNRPTGIERWNLIEQNKSLEELKFTLAYESPDRLSEFIGESGTTKDSTDEELTAIYTIAHNAYLTRTRDNTLWQTVHSVVYSLKSMEHLYVQEDYSKDFGEAKAGGSGLPDVEGSGKALISINGEWVEQSGYGYETVTEQAIFEGEVTTVGEEGEIAIGEFSSSVVIEDEKTYKVIFDGNEYEVEGRKKSIPQAGIDVFFLGEMTESLQPSFTNYPFVLFYIPMHGTEMYTEIAGTYSVSITMDSKSIIEISPKYLPKNGFGYEKQISLYDGNFTITPESPAASLSLPYSITEGQIYKVFFVDTEYICIAIRTPGSNLTLQSIDETSLPFTIYAYDVMSNYAEIRVDESGTYYLRMTTTQVHKIDSKYLPDDPTHRTVTDAEKSTWNAKQDALGYIPYSSTNPAGYQTAAEVSSAIASAIGNAIGGAY